MKWTRIRIWIRNIFYFYFFFCKSATILPARQNNTYGLVIVVRCGEDIIRTGDNRNFLRASLKNLRYKVYLLNEKKKTNVLYYNVQSVLRHLS